MALIFLGSAILKRVFTIILEWSDAWIFFTHVPHMFFFGEFGLKTPGPVRLSVLQWALVVLAVAVSVYAHAGVFDAFLAPTYGNTGIHQANARELVDTGHYPFYDDFSYGGGIPNLYVPVYRFALAQVVVLSGLDFDSAQRWMVMLFALSLPLAFFAFGSVFGAWTGIAAAFLASLPSELLVYTIRPLPQGLGLVLLALAFALVLRQSRAAILAGVLLAMVHQEAAIFFAVAVFAVGIAGKLYDYAAKTDTPMALTALWAWAATTATYLGWNLLILGNLDVFALAQFQHHEGGPVSLSLLQDKTGLLLLALAVLGTVLAAWVVLQAWKKRKAFGFEAFGLVVLLVGLVAVKNDVLGISVFMDRFIVYWQFAFIFLAACGLVKALEWIAGRPAASAAPALEPA